MSYPENMQRINPVDHLIFASSDLKSGIEHAADLLGVIPTRGGQHPAWGTHNAMLSLGASTYFEIIAPDPDAIDGFHGPQIFTGSEVGSLTTWAAALDDLPSKYARAAKAGHRFGDVLKGSRLTESGVRLEWSLTNPMTRLMDGVVPFLIDWGSSPHPSESSTKGCLLRELTLSHPDSDLVATILSDTGIELRDILQIHTSDHSGLTAVIETPRGEIQIQG